MRLLADMHISPRTVAFLRAAGHDVVRVDGVLPNTSSDETILAFARQTNRTILTQDLDFSSLIALGGETGPSVISLRLSSLQVDHINEVLLALLPRIESSIERGAILSVEDSRIRQRDLPVR